MTQTVDYDALCRENWQAHREDAEWLEEIRRWQAEHHRVLGWLKTVEKVWRDAADLLAAHAEAIRGQQECLQAHEQEVSAHQSDELERVDARVLRDHRGLEAKHAEVKKAHEEIRGRHQAVMSEVRELLRTALGGAIVPEWVSPDGSFEE